MPFAREQSQLLATIKKAGGGSKGRLQTFTSDPFGGGGVGLDLDEEVYFAQVEYNSKDLADTTLANGLFKLIIPVIDDQGVVNNNLKKLITDKTGKFLYPDGRSVSIIRSKITSPDGVTPILLRIYLGG